MSLVYLLVITTLVGLDSFYFCFLPGHSDGEGLRWGAIASCVVLISAYVGGMFLAERLLTPYIWWSCLWVALVNARLYFVGSDDVPAEAKIESTRDINQALEAGWLGLNIAGAVPLDQIARAHELVEHPTKPGRVIVAVAGR